MLSTLALLDRLRGLIPRWPAPGDVVRVLPVGLVGTVESVRPDGLLTASAGVYRVVAWAREVDVLWAADLPEASAEDLEFEEWCDLEVEPA